MKSSRLNKRRILLIAVSIVVIFALCVGFFVFKGNRSSAPQNEGSNITISSAKDAVVQLKKLGSDLGYENALSELTEKSTTTIDGDTYYRLQQNYQGIPVYGRTVVCVTNENGEAMAITGNVIDVSENMDLTPTLTAMEAEFSIETYMTNELGYADTETVSIRSLDNADLNIYNMNGMETARLAYVLHTDFCEFIIDAHEGDVLSCSKILSESDTTIGYIASDVSHKNGFEITKNDAGIYELTDASHKLSVYTLQGYESGDLSTAVLIESEDVIFGNTQSEISLDVEAGVQLLLNVIEIQDYFSGLNFIPTGEKTLLFYNDGYDNGENARGGYGNVTFPQLNENGTSYGLMFIGAVTGVNDIDVIAHEYTHRVSKQIVGWSGNVTQNAALDEAFSDIFGVIIEAKLSSNSPDWTMEGDNIGVYRNIANPKETGYRAVLTDENNSSSKEEYAYSTVISHAAYLMSEDGGGLLSIDELATLWYRAMLMMPSDCDFAECRTLVELAAKSMGLSDAQRSCIGEAFGAVGITDGEIVDYELSSSATLCVYGADLNLYGSYTMKIAGTQTIWDQDADPTTDDIYNYYIYFRQNTTTEKYYETRKITSSEPVSLDLDYGTYTITLIDDEGSGTSVSFKIKVGTRDGKDNLNVYTDFGKDSSNGTTLAVDTFAAVVEQCIEKCAYYSLSDEQQQICRGLLYDLNDDGQDELLLQYLNNSSYTLEVWCDIGGQVVCVCSSITDDGLSYQNLGVGVGLGAHNGERYLVWFWEYADEIQPNNTNFIKEKEVIYKITNGNYEYSDILKTSELEHISDVIEVGYPYYKGGMSLSELLSYLKKEGVATSPNTELKDAVCYNGHYYKVYNGQSSWEDAAAFCQSVGGHLATITSEEENTFLYDYLVSLGLSGAYFGFSDVNIEGEWVWCTGEDVIFTNWDTGEPNNEGRKEHYGLFDFSHNDGKWNDGSYRSGTNANFICEWDAAVPPDTGNSGSTKTVYLLKQAVTYKVDYDSQPSKTKTFQYNQDGQLNGVTVETVSKRTQNGETSYKKQLLEYNLECDESGCYTGFSASLDGSYSGKGTITCDTSGRIVEFCSSETGQTYFFSYNADSLISEYIYEYNGEIYTQSTMQYDSRGNVVATERIQRDGSRSELRTEIEYDVGDGLVMMTQYIDGVEQNSILQRCDTYGNVMKEEYYEDGVLTGWIEYTYEEMAVPDTWQKLPDIIVTLLGG